jgi:hypothetical protein
VNFGEHPFQRPSAKYLTRRRCGCENPRKAPFSAHIPSETSRIHGPDAAKATFQTVSAETVWRVPNGIAVAYASRLGEQKIPYRPVRRRMESHRPAPSRTQRARTPQDPRRPRDPRRRLLRPKERLSLKTPAEKPSALEDRLLMVQEVENQRYLQALERRAAPTVTGLLRWKTAPQHRHRELPVRQDDRGRRRSARIRRRKGGPRPQAPHTRGHRKDWSSRPRYTARGYPTRTD